MVPDVLLTRLSNYSPWWPRQARQHGPLSVPDPRHPIRPRRPAPAERVLLREDQALDPFSRVSGGYGRARPAVYHPVCVLGWHAPPGRQGRCVV